MITDFRETNPNISRGLNRATTFLSLVSLIALIIGAIGVSTAMHSHLQQKMDTIATLKSLGARSGQVIRIYLIQTALLGLAGGLVGVVVGAAVQRIFPEFIDRYFHMRPDNWFTPSSAVQGLLVGLLITLLFTLPPLLNIRKVKPALILRRDMAEIRPGWRQRLSEAPSRNPCGPGDLCRAWRRRNMACAWKLERCGAHRRLLRRWFTGQPGIAVRFRGVASQSCSDGGHSCSDAGHYASCACESLPARKPIESRADGAGSRCDVYVDDIPCPTLRACGNSPQRATGHG